MKNVISLRKRRILNWIWGLAKFTGTLASKTNKILEKFPLFVVKINILKVIFWYVEFAKKFCFHGIAPSYISKIDRLQNSALKCIWNGDSHWLTRIRTLIGLDCHIDLQTNSMLWNSTVYLNAILDQKFGIFHSKHIANIWFLSVHIWNIRFLELMNWVSDKPIG